jgi:hypothetical protein
MGIVPPPSGGLIGNSNYWITSNGNPITDLSIELKISQEILSPVVGFQLNCWSPSAKTQWPNWGSPTVWQQYIIGFNDSNDTASFGWQIDNWPSAELATVLKLPSGSDLINRGGSLLTLPEHGPIIPSGYTLYIQLANDPETANIIGVIFDVIDNKGHHSSSDWMALAGQPISNLSDQWIVPAMLAPIVAVQMNIVGPDGGAITLLQSGGGTITYRAISELYVQNEQPSALAYGGHTEEESNAAYGALSAGPSSTLVQSFSTPALVFPPGGPVAATYVNNANETQVFAIGLDGQLYAFSIENGEGPTPIGQAGATVGTGIAVSEQFGAGGFGVYDLFVVGVNNQLQVYSNDIYGDWSGPVGISPEGVVALGSGLAACQQFGVPDQTDVFVVDITGTLVVYWKKGNKPGWKGPHAISAPNFAPTGAPIAVCLRNSTQTDVFVIDSAGRLNVASVVGAGVAWSGPSAISAAIFPPGANLAASQQFGLNNQTDVFVVDNGGRINVFWAEGVGEWSGPNEIGAAGLAKPGAPLIAMEQLGSDNQIDLLCAGNDGQIHLFCTKNGSAWEPPSPPLSATLTPPRSVPPGAFLATAAQSSVPNRTDIFFINNAAQPIMLWVVNEGGWQYGGIL